MMWKTAEAVDAMRWPNEIVACTMGLQKGVKYISQRTTTGSVSSAIHFSIQKYPPPMVDYSRLIGSKFIGFHSSTK